MRRYWPATLLILVTSFPLSASAQANCTQWLLEARRLYDAGRFSQTLAALDTLASLECGDRIVRAQGVRRRALVYISADSSRDAVSAQVRTLLRLNPRYVPSPTEDPVLLRNLVQSRKKFLRRRRILVYGTIGAAGIAALAIGIDQLTKPAEADPLPGFPGPPIDP